MKAVICDSCNKHIAVGDTVEIISGEHSWYIDLCDKCEKRIVNKIKNFIEKTLEKELSLKNERSE